jgi:hypothetical protein
MDTNDDVTITLTGKWQDTRAYGPRRMWTHTIKWGDRVYESDGPLEADEVLGAAAATRHFAKLADLAGVLRQREKKAASNA